MTDSHLNEIVNYQTQKSNCISLISKQCRNVLQILRLVKAAPPMPPNNNSYYQGY